MQAEWDIYGRIDSRRREKAERMLRELQFADHSLGTLYLRDALERVSLRPELGRDLSRHLYPYLAEKHHSTPVRVERNIRYAIESAWSRCHPQVAERYFGYTTDPDKGKPTNRELINTLALFLQYP